MRACLRLVRSPKSRDTVMTASHTYFASRGSQKPITSAKRGWVFWLLWVKPRPPPTVTLKPSSLSSWMIAMKPQQCAKTSTSLHGGIATATLYFLGRYVLPYSGSSSKGVEPKICVFSAISSPCIKKISWYAPVRGKQWSWMAYVWATISSMSLRLHTAGFDVHMTLRQTSPHAASVSMHARLTARMRGLTSRLTTPWNCQVCRVVIFNVPLAYRWHVSSMASHCSAVQ
mmetsp:Transcript_90518/g.277201  ORF Transcript_90518/g.277201 Transcript_90518/m.277201 type:complete len:229 (-) Transcript_90518:357-1043(-)